MTTLAHAPRPIRRPAPRRPGRSRPGRAVLAPWLAAQAVNVRRHAEALRDFQREEFGSSAAAPSEGHIQAVNGLMGRLRQGLLTMAVDVGEAAQVATREPTAARLTRLLRSKEHAHTWVRAIERVWDFYFELFGQRQSRYADWLLSCDRIALDCYRAAFMGIGVARSVPAPPPFSYMRTGFSPATYRRGIPLRALGRQKNPFPLIQLPYHRLVNPWTLGAVLHEVSHNLQNDLGLSASVPRRMGQTLLRAGFPRAVAAVWARWNREIFADLSGLLLGGPAIVASLMDVVGRGAPTVLTYDPNGVHPTPYLRTLLSVELLRRMGFLAEAEQYRGAWMALYPNPRAGTLPPELLANATRACAVVVDALCYRPFAELGDKAYAEVIPFGRKEQQMIEEVAQRLGTGTDPGVTPERFLIAASRIALDRRLAAPEQIAVNFYTELARR